MNAPNTPGWDPAKTYTGDPRRGRHVIRIDLGGGSYLQDCYFSEVKYAGDFEPPALPAIWVLR